MKISALFILLFAVVEATDNTRKCHFDTVLNCGFKKFNFVKEYGVPFPTNEKELTRQCEIFKDIKDCAYNYGQNCTSSMDRIIGNFILSGTSKKMDDLCNPQKQLYKDYLSDKDCIKNNMGGFVLCFKDMLASLQLMYKDSTGSKLLIFCCGLNRMRNCTLDHYGSKCNRKTAELMEMQVQIIFSDWVLGMCNPYFELKKECATVVPASNVLEEKYKTYGFIKYIAPFDID